MSLIARDYHQTLMEPAATPDFLAELDEVWGRRWGAWDEVGRLRSVLVRTPGDELERIREEHWNEAAQALVDPDGLWYWADRSAPDLERVAAQHAGLVNALEAENVEVVTAPPMGGKFVKSTYVRDPLVTIPGGAVIGRLAMRMRRGEEPDVTRHIAAAGLPILGTITGAGTLEGGSFVKLRPGIAALGLSIRCNENGAAQLREQLARIGWELLVVHLPGYTIHLDLHLALVDVDKALINPAGLPYWFLQRLAKLGFQAIHPDPLEVWALNALCVSPGRVLMADGSPRTVERLRAAGVEVVCIPYDEIHKGGGGIHCSTMELLRDPAPMLN